MNDSNGDQPLLALPLPTPLLMPTVEVVSIAEISSYVRTRSVELAAEAQLGWVGDDVAYPTCAELNYLVAISKAWNVSLSIPTAGSKNSIFHDPSVMIALQFIRFIARFRRDDCTCNVGAEFFANAVVLEEAKTGGVSLTAQRYLHGELTGVTELRALGYGTPINPQEFTRDVLALGVPEAIILELERRQEGGEHGRHRARGRAA